MRIGFLLPANHVFTGPANGVRAQAEGQAAAMEALGHQVVRMEPWQSYDLATFDVIQFFFGGFYNLGIEGSFPRLAWAPIIDSNEPNWRYRLAARLGHFHPKIYTIPGTFQDQALGCKLVVCRSRYEQRRVVDGLGVDEQRTEVVLNGTNPPTGDADPDGIRRRLNLPKDFILNVSTYTQGRKNAVRLAEVVGPTGLPLVFAGTVKEGSVWTRLLELAKQFPHIRLLGYQDPVSLNSLLAACNVFCLPSYHEGTGLAALEAGSLGAKVVITKNGGTRDYFANSVDYVDPEDPEDIRQAVLSAWNRPRTDALRNHISQNLTWAKSAEQLLAAYSKHIS